MPNHLAIALQEMFVKEISGGVDNPRILEYFAKVGHEWVKEDETAWCAAFLGFCLEEAGLPSTRKLNARSYLTYGQPTTKPEVGDIVVLWRNDRKGWQGHVGFYINEDENGIRILGGNQANQVNIQEYPRYRLLQYRRPQYPDVKLIEIPLEKLIQELHRRFPQ